MDEILQSINEEQAEVEKSAGEFANTMKTYINFRDEANRVRVKHVEKEISADILYEENEELKEQVREIYEQTNEIKERRAIGLEGLRRETEEMKCTTEMIRAKNEESEKEIRLKVEEFNRIKMMLVDKGIEYVTKRKPVQKTDRGTSFPNGTTSISPTLRTKSVVDPSVEMDICNVQNVPPETEMLHDRKEESLDSFQNKSFKTEMFNSHQNYKITTSETNHGRCADRSGIIIDSQVAIDLQNESCNKDKTLPKHIESEELRQQTSASELIRLPEVRKSKSRIPKPVVQPFGSASRDGDRFVVSKSNSLVVIQSDRYSREELVPKEQRHVTHPTMNYLDPETELRRLKNRSSTVKVDNRGKQLLKNDCAIRCERGGDESELYSYTDKRDKYCEEKLKHTRIKKNEVKSKIDTGLKTRSNNVAKRATSNKIDTKRGRNECSNLKGKERPYVKLKEFELPPLRITPRATKVITNMPESSRSINGMTPLPKLKQLSRQSIDGKTHLPPIKQNPRTDSKSIQKVPVRKDTISGSNRFSDPLPSIAKTDDKTQKLSLTINGTSQRSRARTKRLPPIESAQSRGQNSSNKRKPEASEISLSPFTTQNNRRPRKQNGRRHNSTRQRDDKRVSSGRA